jgi:3-deoxy-D-manno-octulosonic-acid transferase
MFVLYGIVLTAAFLILLPRFVFAAIFNGKYAAGFSQRLGFLPPFHQKGTPVIWLHAVSVGEVNAARPLVELIRSDFPDYRIVISTTTKTGQTLAREVFSGAAAVFYFPFDWKLTVRRALRHFSPSIVLLMETEIWPNFIRESHRSGSRVAIVNGRLSERSAKRYAYFPHFVRHVLSYVDLALMQANADAGRMVGMCMRPGKVKVTGNLKFDHAVPETEGTLTREFRERFAISAEAPLIIAASTHEPEELMVLRGLRSVWTSSAHGLARLMIVPRHPERFEAVADLIKKSGFAWVRRSEKPSARDATAEVILLDSIGELRAALPLAEIVFVGGSLIPHGGQSILEPAACGKAIVTGPHTANFTAAVDQFIKNKALIQLESGDAKTLETSLALAFEKLLSDADLRHKLGANALAEMAKNAGATAKTIDLLRPLIEGEARE